LMLCPSCLLKIRDGLGATRMVI